MRMLKCYLANNRRGHFVTADEAMSAPAYLWSCASCGCRLALHASYWPGLNTTSAQWRNMYR
ncbi:MULTISPECIES: DUF7828 domain-containing protein [Enterobacteriaceae]|nr:MULTISPECIES: putative zinc ribbon protein [Enterobacteriaceae]